MRSSRAITQLLCPSVRDLARSGLIINNTRANITNSMPITNGVTNMSTTNGIHRATDEDYTVLDKKRVQFLDNVQKILLNEGVVGASKRETKVVDFKHPAELQKTLNLTIEENGASSEELLDIVRDTIKYSVHTGQPRFFNQQYGNRDPYGLAAAWTMEALNTNAHTFEVAPVFVLTERYTINKIVDLIGYTDGDGLTFPGGNTGMNAAVHLARYRKNPELKFKGLSGSKPLAMFISEDAHYGAKISAAVTGVGLDNVYAVKSDSKGKMCMKDLQSKIDQSISEGKEPFFAVATCSTTVIGAFDPIENIVDICEKYGIWVHADAAWGGAVLLSNTYKHLLKGVNRTDSFLWNAHKMMGTPLQCTVLAIKHKGLLEECNSVKAAYLYQQDKFYDVSFDIGDKSIQCGRKPDAYKLWMMWKAYGDQGMQALVDKKFDNARYLEEQMNKREGFRLCIPEHECLNVCFWYIPKSLRGQEETEEWRQKLSLVAPKIKEGMTMNGTMLIGYNPLASQGWVNFFRIIIHNDDLTHRDMDFVCDEIQRLGEHL